MMNNALTRFCIMILSSFCLLSGTTFAADSVQASDSYLITKVTDGDSLRAGEIRIRLHGIDAPEMKQICEGADGGSYHCGMASRDHLIALLQPPTELRCQTITKDRYGRFVMRCFKAGIDINAAMVRDGWAVAYRRYSKDYIADENHAKALNNGLFAGSFQKPEQWRRQN